MYKLEGMYAAIPTPFFEDESIDFEGIKTLVNYLADQGLHGVIAGGSTGEYTMLSEEERRGVIKAACEAGKGRIDVVAGTGCPRAVDTIELCNFAAECGADAALVITPHYMVMTEDMLYDYYKTVAEGSKLPIIIYHYSLATGVSLAPAFIKKLAELDNMSPSAMTAWPSRTSARADTPPWASFTTSFPRPWSGSIPASGKTTWQKPPASANPSTSW